MTETFYFNQKEGLPIWNYYFLIFPVIILFLGPPPIVGIGIVLVFVIAILAAFVEKNKERKKSYSEIEISSEKIILTKADGKKKQFLFSSIDKISFLNKYSKNRYNMELWKTGQEVCLWNDKSSLLTSFEYTDYIESDKLKNLLIENSKLDSNKIIFVD
jgi:hypothetical protein